MWSCSTQGGSSVAPGLKQRATGEESVAPIGWPVHEKTGLPLTTLCFFPLPLLILSEFEGEET